MSSLLPSRDHECWHRVGKSKEGVPDQVAELERQVALGCKAGTAMLLERLAQAPATAGAGSMAPAAAAEREHQQQQQPAAAAGGGCAQAGGSCMEAAAAEPLQARLCAWLGSAFEALQAGGVASSSRRARGHASAAASGEGAGSDAESSSVDSEASDDEDDEGASRASAGDKRAAQVRHGPCGACTVKRWWKCS